MTSVYRKALWDQRRSLPAWASALALFILLESALWPCLDTMAGLQTYLAELPPALRELFSLDRMGTGRGFLNAELFSLMLPVMFLVYGVSRGARMIAGEEEEGTLDLLVVTPFSAARLLLEEFAALATGLLLLGLAVAASTLLGSALFGLGIGPGEAAAGSVAVVLIGLELGTVALAVGALTGRRGLALGAASGLALAAYLLYVAGTFVEAVGSWRGWSPFDQALSGGPLASALPAASVWLAVVPLACVLLTAPTWSRRDIGARR